VLVGQRVQLGRHNGARRRWSLGPLGAVMRAAGGLGGAWRRWRLEVEGRRVRVEVELEVGAPRECEREWKWSGSGREMSTIKTMAPNFIVIFSPRSAVGWCTVRCAADCV